jgi:hypothetical protein
MIFTIYLFEYHLWIYNFFQLFFSNIILQFDTLKMIDNIINIQVLCNLIWYIL